MRLGLTKFHSLLQAIKALTAALAPKARAIRDGKLEQVDAATLVPGDIVLISIGNIVPADIKLLGEEGDDVPMQVSCNSSACFLPLHEGLQDPRLTQSLSLHRLTRLRSLASLCPQKSSLATSAFPAPPSSRARSTPWSTPRE